jgi:hypothetical protein
MSGGHPMRVVYVYVLGQQRAALAHYTREPDANRIVQDFQTGTTRVLTIGTAHFDRRHVTHLTVSTP